MDTVSVSVRFTRQQHEALKSLHRPFYTVCDAIREAVDKFLKDHVSSESGDNQTTAQVASEEICVCCVAKWHDSCMKGKPHPDTGKILACACTDKYHTAKKTGPLPAKTHPWLCPNCLAGECTAKGCNGGRCTCPGHEKESN